MSFARPEFLPFLGLVAVVPLLYLVRRRSRRAPVPHLFLWERALAAEGRSRRSRIHDLLGLILNAALVALLVLAAAGPRRERESPLPRASYIVLDGSLSLSAREPSGLGREEEARGLARELLPELMGEGPVGLVLADRSPRLLAALGSDETTLVRLLDQPIGGRGRLDLPALLDFLRAARGDEPTLRAVLVSDGAFAAEEGELAAAGVELRRTAALARNAALVSCRLLERASDRFRIAVEVAASGGPMSGELALEVPGGEGEAKPFALADGAVAALELAGRLREAGFVRLVLRAEGDALAADDALDFHLERDPRVRVLVVAEEAGVPLTAALAALDEVFDPAAAARVAPADWRRAELGSYDLVVMRGVTERRPLPPARYLLIDSWAPGLPFRIDGELDRPALLRQERASPLLRALDLRDLEVIRARRVRAEPGVDVVLDSDGGPLVLRGRDFVHLAFDIDEKTTSLVLLPAFPLLLKDAARALVPEPVRFLPGAAAAGLPNELLRPLGPGEALIELGDDDRPGADLLLPGGLAFRAPERSGRLRLRVDGDEETLGLGVLDREASTLAPGPMRGAAAPGPPARERRPESLLPRFLAAAFGLLLIEWLLFSRGLSR